MQGLAATSKGDSRYACDGICRSGGEGASVELGQILNRTPDIARWMRRLMKSLKVLWNFTKKRKARAKAKERKSDI